MSQMTGLRISRRDIVKLERVAAISTSARGFAAWVMTVLDYLNISCQIDKLIVQSCPTAPTGHHGVLAYMSMEDLENT